MERVAAMRYRAVSTWATGKVTMNTGGLCKRYMTEPILNSVVVDDIGAVQANAENPCGRIIMPKEKIAGVGLVVMILDTERNGVGLWKPVRKWAGTVWGVPPSPPRPRARKSGGSAAMSRDAGTVNPVTRGLPVKRFARHLCIIEMLRKKLLLLNNQSGSGQNTWLRRGRKWKLFRK
jgi:predicted enzyme related to lactoylglutathione lyase